MTDKYLRAAQGDRWLASILRRAANLCASGQGFQLVNIGEGRRWAACYIVRAFGLDG